MGFIYSETPCSKYRLILNYNSYIMNVRNKVTVRFNDGVECSIIAKSAPCITTLGY